MNPDSDHLDLDELHDLIAAHTPVDTLALARHTAPFLGPHAPLLLRALHCCFERLRRGGVTELLEALRTLDAHPAHLDGWFRTQQGVAAHLDRAIPHPSREPLVDVLAAAILADSLPAELAAAARTLARPLRDVHLLAELLEDEPPVGEVLATLALDDPAAPLVDLIPTARLILTTTP